LPTGTSGDYPTFLIGKVTNMNTTSQSLHSNSEGYPPYFSGNMSDNKIFLLATGCESLFQKALAAALPSNLQVPLYRALLDCHSRFEVWAGVTGAFADEEASLDRRLMFSPDLQSAVVRLMTLITTSLEPGKPARSITFRLRLTFTDLVSDCNACAESTESMQHDEYQDTKHTSILAQLPPLTRTSLIGIHEAIDRLECIATSIKRVANSTVTSRVEGFAQRFERDDFDAIAVLLVRGLYPQLPETLVRQLGSSIAFRRLRLLFQRRNQQKLQQHRHTDLQEHQNHKALAMNVELPTEATPTKGPVRQQLAMNQMSATFDNLSVTDHSVVEPVQILEDVSDQQSIRSGSSIISSVVQSHLYPKQPKPTESSEYCRCNWCFEEIKAEKLQRKGWWMYVVSRSCRAWR
jgi:hypothetical protein